MTVYRQAPRYEQPLMIDKNTSSWWYRWFQDTDTGTPPSSELAVSVTASPFIYTAPSKGILIVNGGTVSNVSLTRVGTYMTGQTQGLFSLSLGDRLTITYSVIPTLTFVPQ